MEETSNLFFDSKAVFAFSSRVDMLQLIYSFGSTLSISFSQCPLLTIPIAKKEAEIIYYHATGTQINEQLYLLKNRQESGVVLSSEKKMDYLLIVSHSAFFDVPTFSTALQNIEAIDIVKIIDEDSLPKRKTSLLNMILQHLD